MAPTSDKRTKAYKDFSEAHWNYDIVTQEELATLAEMENALKSHKVASQMFNDSAIYEMSGYTELQGVPVRIRPDVRDPASGIIWDLKTSRDCTPESFTRDVLYGLRYDVQAALYTDVAAWIDERDYIFRWVVIEKEAPYAINVFEATSETIAKGRRDYLDALATYKKCLEFNNYPCYAQELKWI